MKNQQWTWIDKSKWPDGPWNDEPDKMQWTDEATGLPCLIVRVPDSGHLCGYVGVSKDHPMHGKDYDHESFSPEVHGGLTFADKCHPNSNEGRGVCHIVEAGEDDDVWWLGFDCAHCCDISPTRGWSYSDHNASYRTVEYVQSECRSLAKQLQEVLKGKEQA